MRPLLALLVPAAALIAGAAHATGAMSERAFIDALAGMWSGRAVTTPIGPHPYDMTFERQPDGSVSGAADTGGSWHHWRFLPDDDGLRIYFLTTFRGNTDPIWLRQTERLADGLRFRAEKPEYLRVDIHPTASTITFHIFLGEQPHVDIELERLP